MSVPTPHYRLLRQLGRPRSDRTIWQVDTDDRAATVKALTNPYAAQKLDWLRRALGVLESRRYPVPRIIGKARSRLAATS